MASLGGQDTPPPPDSLGALGAALHPPPKTLGFFLGGVILGCSLAHPGVQKGLGGGPPQGDTPSLQKGGRTQLSWPPRTEAGLSRPAPQLSQKPRFCDRF